MASRSESRPLTLYDLGAEWVALEAALLEAGGEVTPEVEQALAALGELEASKVDAYAFLVRNLEGYADRVRAEEQALAAKRKAAENSARRLKERLLGHLELRGLDKLAGSIWTAARQANPASVEVLVPPEELPEAYRVVTVEANKRQLLADLKAGTPLPGVASVAPTTYHLRIR
jgi:outer membrane murein-binding lipoprotein Lpp